MKQKIAKPYKKPKKGKRIVKDREKKKRIMLENHWSKQSSIKKEKTRKKISKTMEEYHRHRLTKLPFVKNRNEQKSIIHSKSNF